MSHFRPLGDADADTELDTEVTQQVLDLWPGRVVDDRYEIVDRIAAGGMGAVYTARHTALGKLVAFKTIHPNLVGDADLTARFAREAMTSAQLDHPHVASALDYGRLAEGAAYIVFQLVRGKSIHQVVCEEGALSWKRAALIASQIADALVFAHARQIIHRDLKPENILLEARDDGADHARVLDFGVARVGEAPTSAAPKGAAPLTRRGVIVGTPGYMPPEQALAEPTDHRADIYALGVVLWEMLAGKALFPQSSMSEIVSAQIALVEPPPLPAGTPEPLRHLLKLMLAPRPDDRPSAVLEVRDILRDLVNRATAQREPSLRTTRETISLSHQAPPATPKRTPYLLLAAGALTLIVIIAVALAFNRTPEEPAPQALVEQIREQVEAEHAASELDRWVDVLVSDSNRDRRRTASTFILAHDPPSQVPEWIRVLAELEAAQGCDPINAALSRLAALHDARTAGPFRRFERRVTSRRLRRFYRCLDDRLAEARSALPNADEQLEDDGTLGADELSDIESNSP